MTDKVIVYTQKNGRMAVCMPAPAGRLENESEDVWLARVIKRSVPSEVKDAKIIRASDLPKDRGFRDAWKHTGGKVAVDMAGAREIQRKKIRIARKSMLRDLDVAYQRADETGDQKGKSDVAARKQRLREATAHPDIDAAKTPDELKAVWPL